MTEHVSLVITKINGLKDELYHNPDKCCYLWYIDLHLPWYVSRTQKISIFIGNDEKSPEEIERLHKLFKSNFNSAEIKEGNKIAVLIGSNGSPVAIGSLKKDIDCWIDVRDKLAPKSFIELDVAITDWN